MRRAEDFIRNFDPAMPDCFWTVIRVRDGPTEETEEVVHESARQIWIDPLAHNKENNRRRWQVCGLRMPGGRPLEPTSFTLGGWLAYGAEVGFQSINLPSISLLQQHGVNPMLQSPVSVPHTFRSGVFLFHVRLGRQCRYYQAVLLPSNNPAANRALLRFTFVSGIDDVNIFSEWLQIVGCGHQQKQSYRIDFAPGLPEPSDSKNRLQQQNTASASAIDGSTSVLQYGLKHSDNRSLDNVPGRSIERTAFSISSTRIHVDRKSRRLTEEVRASGRQFSEMSPIKVLYDTGSPYNMIERATVEGNDELESAFIPYHGLDTNGPIVNVGGHACEVLGTVDIVITRISGRRYLIRDCIVFKHDDAFKSFNLIISNTDSQQVLGVEIKPDERGLLVPRLCEISSLELRNVC